MSKAARRRVATAVGVLLLFGFAFSSSYAGRVRSRDDQVRGCHRGLADRRADIQRDGDITRLGADDPVVIDHATGRIKASTSRLVNCDHEYPKPSVLPWSG